MYSAFTSSKLKQLLASTLNLINSCAPVPNIFHIQMIKLLRSIGLIMWFFLAHFYSTVPADSSFFDYVKLLLTLMWSWRAQVPSSRSADGRAYGGGLCGQHFKSVRKKLPQLSYSCSHCFTVCCGVAAISRFTEGEGRIQLCKHKLEATTMRRWHGEPICSMC